MRRFKFIYFLFGFLNMVLPAIADTAPVNELSLLEVRALGDEAATDFGGFTHFDIHTRPFSLGLVSEPMLKESGAKRLSDISDYEAAVTDSYNAAGYWDYISVRGFTLDNRFSYFREGLPIHAGTSIPLDNKAGIEILKGLGGMQTGAGSPGGQVQYLVKRPTFQNRETIVSEIDDEGRFLTAGDAEGVSHSGKQAYRMNIAYEKLSAPIEEGDGQRVLLSLAGDWRWTSKGLFEAEIEWSTQRQRSQAGLSLLGDQLPSPNSPRLNLNNQPWPEPVVFEGLTGTLRYVHLISGDWSASVMAGFQELHSDDYLAYPYGCTAESRWDRYCSDGSFDYYDYRSENERRRTWAWKGALQGAWSGEKWRHQVALSVIAAQSKEDYELQTYNYVGTGHIEGTTMVSPNPAANDQNTNRESSQVDVVVSDVISLGSWKSWLGVKSTMIERKSVRTDGSRPTDYRQSFPVPWLALSKETEDVIYYGSYGEGVESYVVPNKSGYSYPGEYLEDVISHQLELGVKGKMWSAALFEIHRPVVEDQSPHYQIDGKALHRGVEAQFNAEQGRWRWLAAGMWLQVERQKSELSPEVNGMRPVNVPSYTMRLQGSYTLKSLPAASALGRISSEGDRAVTQDNDVMLPAWTRFDVGLRYRYKWHQNEFKWRLDIENLTDARFWKESPTQYGHIYLYPQMERVFRLGLEVVL